MIELLGYWCCCFDLHMFGYRFFLVGSWGRVFGSLGLPVLSSPFGGLCKLAANTT